MKRKRPKDIVDKQVWRVAKLAAMLTSKLRHDSFASDEEWKAYVVTQAIELLNEAQRQVDKDVSKGAEKSGL